MDDSSTVIMALCSFASLLTKSVSRGLQNLNAGPNFQNDNTKQHRSWEPVSATTPKLA